jgi:hypothetical protein
LYTVTKGNVSQLWELHNELVLKRGMSYEKVANLVDIALNKLPYVENLFEQAKWAADKQQERFDSLGNRIRSLEEEKSRKNMITLHPSSYYYLNDREDHVTNKFPYNSASSQPSSLPNESSVNYDAWIEKWIKKR